jgi:hypothetical protein
MFEQIIEGLRPYVEAGFIDDLSSAQTIGEDAFIVQAGTATAIVNCTRKGVEIAFGDNRAAVLSGITPSQTVRFILQALGRADFQLPEVVLSALNDPSVPSEFKQAVVAPIGITQGDDGSHVVFKDAHGKYFILQEDVRVTLKLFKGLYDRNSEAEILRMPRLFQCEVPPTMTKELSALSESTALEIASGFTILSFVDAVAQGVPIRSSALMTMPSGVISQGETLIEATDLVTKAGDFAREWESILSGVTPEAIPEGQFTHVVGDVIKSSDLRAELSFTFSAVWPGGEDRNGLIQDERRIILPRGEALLILEKLDADGASSTPEVVDEIYKRVKVGEQVLASAAVPQRAPIVRPAIVAKVVEDSTNGTLIKSSARPDKPTSLQEFSIACGVPAWLSGCSDFAILTMKQ